MAALRCPVLSAIVIMTLPAEAIAMRWSRLICVLVRMLGVAIVTIVVIRTTAHTRNSQSDCRSGSSKDNALLVDGPLRLPPHYAATNITSTGTILNASNSL